MQLPAGSSTAPSLYFNQASGQQEASQNNLPPSAPVASQPCQMYRCSTGERKHCQSPPGRGGGGAPPERGAAAARGGRNARAAAPPLRRHLLLLRRPQLAGAPPPQRPQRLDPSCTAGCSAAACPQASCIEFIANLQVAIKSRQKHRFSSAAACPRASCIALRFAACRQLPRCFMML